MTGFLQIYNGGSSNAITPFAIAAGLIADEYGSPQTDGLDQRSGDGNAEFTWRDMSMTHLNAGQAIQYLKAYAPNASPSYLAKAYMARGYMQLFMSELFCSGVPLSEAHADGTTTVGRPISREDLQKSALAQFDSALQVVETDSARIINALKVGRARVLMNLERYDDAVSAVSGVPTSFSYDMQYTSTLGEGTTYFQTRTWEFVANEEGVNGIDYVAARDPRLVLDSLPSINGYAIWVPRKFRTSGSVNIPLATGVSARLIEAEVMLSNNNVSGWLQALNALRTTCTSAATCPDPAPAGTGGIAGLAPLTDPGTREGRLRLLFRERAFWQFGTGQRQGDLRRLLRQYDFRQDQVYPTGPYGLGFQYGVEVTATPGSSERANNPYYKDGCFDRGA